MAIYDVNGALLINAYDVNGNSLQSAYDVNGNQIFSAAPLPLKIMTYNVGGWYTGSGGNVPTEKKSEYLALHTGMIEDNDPDVLVIQEYLANFSADGTSAKTLLESLFPYVHTKTSGTYYGRAVCSKYPISDYTERTYTAESNRYFDSCIITVSGVPITIVDTHLGLTQANRDSEIAQLIPFLQSWDRVICCGDYNTGIINSSSTEMYQSNIVPFINAGFNLANCNGDTFLVTYSNEPTSTGTSCLDNIITSQSVAIDNVYVDTTKLTDNIEDKVDHMPLIAEVLVSTEPPTPPEPLPAIDWDLEWDYSDGLMSENGFTNNISGTASETLLDNSVMLTATDSGYVVVRPTTETCTSGVAEYVFSGNTYDTNTGRGARFMLSNGSTGLQIFIQNPTGNIKYQSGSTLIDTGATCGDGQDHTLRFEFNRDWVNYIYLDGNLIYSTRIMSNQYVVKNNIFAQGNTTIYMKSAKYAFNYFTQS